MSDNDTYSPQGKYHPPACAPPGITAASSLTFRQVVDACLSGKEDTLKRSTCNQYRNQCNNHLLSECGDQLFSSITEDQLNDLLRSKLKEGYKVSTVMNLRTILMMVIRFAKQNGIPTSVSAPLFTPRRQSTQIQVFTRKEQRQIESVLYNRDEPYNLAIFLALYCGLRIGEVCALQWQDINFRSGTITVTKTLHRIQNPDDTSSRTNVTTDLPKTHSSIRTIPIPVFLMPMLRHYRKKDTDYVITGTEYSMEPRNCLRRYKTVLRSARVSDYSFHALRHTFATRCVETGMDTKSLSEILGHSSVKITLDRYVHPSMDFKRTQINKLKKITKIDV